ncbi:MAG: SH3 domain-containing protein, partial [Chloroflexota bacterium]
AYLSNVPDNLTLWSPVGAVAPEAPEAATDEEPPFSEDVVNATTTANLRIRNAPSTDGEVLTILPFGTVVGFTGLTDTTGDWVQVDAVDGPIGWVWAEFLSNVPDNLTVWTGD